MEEGSKSRQLRPEERVLIAGMKLQGASMRAMAQALGRPASTVSRELRRNAMTDGGYESQKAQAAHAARRRAARAPKKLNTWGVLWGAVATMLSWKWSPQQIAATLRRVYPDDPDFHVSHETIYTAIYAHARTRGDQNSSADFSLTT